MQRDDDFRHVGINISSLLPGGPSRTLRGFAHIEHMGDLGVHNRLSGSGIGGLHAGPPSQHARHRDAGAGTARVGGIGSVSAKKERSDPQV